MGALLQVFGVTAEGDAGVVDDALVHGRRYQGVELSGERPLDGAIEQREHVARVRRVRPAGDTRCGERQMLDEEPATPLRRRRPRRLRPPVLAQADIEAQGTGTFLEQRPVGEANELTRQLLRRERETQLRSDSRRLATGERDTGNHRASL